MVLVCLLLCVFFVGFLVWCCWMCFCLLLLRVGFFWGGRGALTTGVGSASNQKLFFLLNFILHHFEDVPLMECIYLHSKLTGES